MVRLAFSRIRFGILRCDFGVNHLGYLPRGGRVCNHGKCPDKGLTDRINELVRWEYIRCGSWNANLMICIICSCVGVWFWCARVSGSGSPLLEESGPTCRRQGSRTAEKKEDDVKRAGRRMLGSG